MQMYCKIRVLDIVQIHLNAPVLESLFNIISGLHYEALLKEGFSGPRVFLSWLYTLKLSGRVGAQKFIITVNQNLWKQAVLGQDTW